MSMRRKRARAWLRCIAGGSVPWAVVLLIEAPGCATTCSEPGSTSCEPDGLHVCSAEGELVVTECPSGESCVISSVLADVSRGLTTSGCAPDACEDACFDEGAEVCELGRIKKCLAVDDTCTAGAVFEDCVDLGQECVVEGGKASCQPGA